MKIILLGYMASGKTTISKQLSRVLNIPFVDLDEFIEEKESSSVTNLFNNKGELYFRKVERRCLEELLLLDKNSIIALGGGTPCYYDNMDLINKNHFTTSIYIRSSLNDLVLRLSKEKSKRPLIADITSDLELKEFVGKHLFERSYFYNKAKFTITNNGVDTTVKEIISLIKANRP